MSNILKLGRVKIFEQCFAFLENNILDANSPRGLECPLQFCWNNFTNTDAGIKLYYFLECNNLYQIIDEPTRITASRESILDLIISDSPVLFTHSGTLSPPANCDHNLIFATLSFPVNRKQSYRRRIWKFNGVNEDALNNTLVNADWESTWLSKLSVLQNCQLAYPAFRKFRKFIID